MNEKVIRKLKLPPHVYALTVKDENDDYNIYLNSECSPETQKKALRHELIHVERDHFYNEMTISEKEVEACGSIFGISAKK